MVESYFYTFCLIVGLFKLVPFLMGIYDFIWRNFIAEEADLLQKYGGEKSWAIVTGASDGIGAEIASQVARKGFNVVLVSRSESKLAKVAQRIQNESKVQVKVVVADFAEMAWDATKYEQLKDKILTDPQIEQIGLLFLNAGLIQFGPLKDQDPKESQAIMDVNSYAPSMMLRDFYPKMGSQKIRSAICVTSSIQAEVHSSGYAAYCGSKHFITALTKGIGMQKPKNLDIMLIHPNFVETSMMDGLKIQNKNLLAVTPARCAQGAIRDLGLIPQNQKETVISHGAPLHGVINEILVFLWRNLPLCIFDLILKNSVSKDKKDK